MNTKHLTMILREGAALGLAGIALGIMGALIAARILSSLLFRTSGTEDIHALHGDGSARRDDFARVLDSSVESDARRSDGGVEARSSGWWLRVGWKEGKREHWKVC